MRRLNAYRIEASWKLGQWSDLEQHLKLVSLHLGLLVSVHV